MEFKRFQEAVQQQMVALASLPLYRAEISGDELWAEYLAAFPEGTNPIFRKRTEHDCGCCKQFIRAVGNVVAVDGTRLVSIWDVTIPGEPAYQTVADALARLVKSSRVQDKFLHYEPHAGTARSLEQMLTGVHTWSHFHVTLPADAVKPKAAIPALLGDARTKHDTLLRALDTITDDALATVLGLIESNTLYRGAEHKLALESFQRLKGTYSTIRADERPTWAWPVSAAVHGSVSGMRNTVIGTLLVELSEGVDLERAVKAYETKVAPTNYKRPTALVTPAMIVKAQTAVAELGLTSALERRYAMIQDISINNVLFANRDARRVMRGDPFTQLAAVTAQRMPAGDHTEEVPVEAFLRDILPSANTLEIMVENRHEPNLVTLTAAADPSAPVLFKWTNSFAWSYNGDVADSIAERVKKAGGSVTGELCCRLAWYNHDDLDLHMLEPSGFEIYFGNKGRLSPSKGMLDVDMNAGRGTTRTPVENIAYESLRAMCNGDYLLYVHQYSNRDKTDPGFDAEIAVGGNVFSFNYARPLPADKSVQIARIRKTDAGIELGASLPESTASREFWGVTTRIWQQVSALMHSPNHWDGVGVGNKHLFFMLPACRNPGTARGFYNEFLCSELDPHRKVIEMVGAKMRTTESENQLSGLGFSYTQRNSVVCRVTGAYTRTVKVTF